jgi:serine protease AprX
VGYAGVTSPGNAPSALTVGALKTLDTERRSDDLVADYSSRGPTWVRRLRQAGRRGPRPPAGVVGDHRRRALHQPAVDARRHRDGKATLRLSGTSMAAAVVSGTVALMVDASRQSFGAWRTRRMPSRRWSSTAP